MTESSRKLSFVAILGKLMPFAQPYRKYIFFSLILTVIGSLAAQVDPLVLRYLVDQVTNLAQGGRTFTESVWVLMAAGAILILKSLLMLATDFGQGYLGETLKVKVAADLSNSAYQHVLALGIPFFETEENASGRLLRRIDRGVEGLSKVVKNLLIDILPLFAKAVLSLVVMFSVNFWVGMLALIIVPVYFALSYSQAKRQEGVRLGIQDLKEKRSGAMLNTLLSIRVIKSFVRERFETRKLQDLNRALSQDEIHHHAVNRLFDALKFSSGEIGAATIIIFTAYLILQGQMSVGAILLHLMLFRNVTAPIRDLHRIYDEHNEAVAFSLGYFELLETPATEEMADNLAGTVPSDELCGDIRLEHVNFSYVPGRPVLHDVNMTLREGQTTALVGLSGAGKTTIASLLVRFYQPDSGRILFGGQAIGDLSPQVLRNQIGMVLQENHIFDGSIADNIRYGDLQAPPEQIQRAAEQAQLHAFVARLPRGYDSPGHQLSGGQKQRVALARVFLKKPKVLILDEPTASLDAVTTEQIKRALDTVRRGRTVLIISHNMSQVIDADYIYVIKEGIIIEEGTHQSLYAAGGHYAEIIDSNIENMNLRKLMEVANHAI